MIQDNSFPQQYTPPPKLGLQGYKKVLVSNQSQIHQNNEIKQKETIDESCQQQNNVSTNSLEQQWHAQMIVIFDWLRVFLGETFITTFWKNGGQGLHTVPWYQTTCKLKKKKILCEKGIFVSIDLGMPFRFSSFIIRELTYKV